MNAGSTLLLLLSPPAASASAAPSGASAAWAASDPTVSASAVASPAGASASWLAAAPSVSAGGSTSVSPSGASAAWAASAPTVAGSAAATPSGATATWVAASPSVTATASATASPPSASAAWAAATVTVTATAPGPIRRVPRRRILLRLATLATSTPAGPLPPDLAAAIVARFDADPTLSGPGAFAAIYRDEAGQRLPDGPYLVFEIRRGSLVYQSSDSKWHDDRVKFVAWSDSGATANDLAEGPVLAAFDGAALSHARGVTTPFVEADRGQGRSPGRSAGGKMGYWASIEFSVRSRTGRPE